MLTGGREMRAGNTIRTDSEFGIENRAVKGDRTRVAFFEPIQRLGGYCTRSSTAFEFRFRLQMRWVEPGDEILYATVENSEDYVGSIGRTAYEGAVTVLSLG